MSRLRLKWKLLVPLALVAVAYLLAPQLAWAAGPEAAGGHGLPLYITVIERFFLALTAGGLAFGILHVEIELLHWGWAWLRGRRPGAAQPAKERNQAAIALVPRFDVHQRIQHFVLMGSFIVLAVTGIPQKFYRYDPFDGFIALMGGMEVVRIIHRVAAGVMIVDGIYHMLYLAPGLLTFRGGLPLMSLTSALEMIPNRKDFTDFFHMMSYFLGAKAEPPRFGRYSYLQKFDYWAVGWGLVIMTASGLILMLPALGFEITGTAAIAAALISHSDEAILATGWILVVHLYHAHLAPRVFPFNTTIFTGYISERQFKEEHSLEYEKWTRRFEAMPKIAVGGRATTTRHR